MGGTGKNGRNAGTLCDGELGTQFKSRASSLREKSVDANSIVGAIRATGSKADRSPKTSTYEVNKYNQLCNLGDLTELCVSAAGVPKQFFPEAHDLFSVVLRNAEIKSDYTGEQP
jgi:hypothetical protein